MWPTLVAGLDGTSLARSVQDELGPVRGERCFEEQSIDDQDTWRCTILGSDSEQAVKYRLRLKPVGCWDATPVDGETPEPSASGCVRLDDHLDW